MLVERETTYRDIESNLLIFYGTHILGVSMEQIWLARNKSWKEGKKVDPNDLSRSINSIARRYWKTLHEKYIRKKANLNSQENSR